MKRLLLVLVLAGCSSAPANKPESAAHRSFAADVLCEKCATKQLIPSRGKCASCGADTEASELVLCRPCARAKNACAWCMAHR